MGGQQPVANTYTQIYIHVVFAVKGRQSLIRNEFKETLYKYISGIIRNEDQKLIAINGMPDHIHLLMGMKPDFALSDLVRDIKASSSKFINEHRLVRGRFQWQEGFGAFSYGQSQLDRVVAYIRDQEKHHRRKSFKGEYVDTLKKFNIPYDGRYVFDEIGGDD